MKQLVYAMRDRKTQLVKIGISIDPNVRTNEVAKQFGADVELLGTLEVEDARKVEQFMHSALAAHRVIGEWFQPDSKTLSYVLAFFVRQENASTQTFREASRTVKPLRPHTVTRAVSMNPTRWKLGTYLAANNITVYELAKHTKGKLSRNALYRLSNEVPTQVRLNTFDTLIPALKKVTGKDVQLSDILEYSDEPS